MDEIAIRAARAEDRPALYEICRLTGDAGTDASGSTMTPTCWARSGWGPTWCSRRTSPSWRSTPPAWPVTCSAPTDTAAFEAACEERWWPDLRASTPSRPGPAPHPRRGAAQVDPPSAADTRRGCSPSIPPTSTSTCSRAPEWGRGRRLVDTLLDVLRRRGVPGVHLGVDATNTRAIGFYEHLGFASLGRDHDGSDGWLFGCGS